MVESNVRSLASLGVESNSYSGLLTSVLISKLPQEIQLIATRTLGNKDWDLDELMKIFEEELQVRERATTVLATNTRKAIKDTPTAAMLEALSINLADLENTRL